MRRITYSRMQIRSRNTILYDPSNLIRLSRLEALKELVTSEVKQEEGNSRMANSSFTITKVYLL